MDLEVTKTSLSKRRKSSVISYEKYMSINGSGGTLIRRKSAQELQLEVDRSVKMRRKSSVGMYLSNSHENLHEQNEIDTRDKFRKILKQLQSVNDDEDVNIKKQKRPNSNCKLKDQQEVKTNQFVSFLRYMTSEHDTLLQILVFLPLILAAFYIAVIEKQPILRYRN